MFCGDLYSIPQNQKDLYFDKEDDNSIFLAREIENVTISGEVSLFDTEECGMIIVFLHPVLFKTLRAEDDDLDEKYRRWLCGEAFVKAIVKTK